MNKIKTILVYIAALATLTLSGALTIAYIYAQEYVQETPTTAVKGIFFKNTIYLKEYKNIGFGNGWLGKHSRYSRSDRMTDADVITVYCKEYCKKD